MNLAVFLPNWVGDVVMATPALRALRQHFRHARLIAVGRSYVAGVLEGCPWFDHHIRDTYWPAVAWRLERIDVAVLFPNSFRAAWIAWLAGCRRRVGYRRYGRGGLLTDGLEPVLDKRGCITPNPIIDEYNRLAEHVGCRAPGHRMELFTTAADESAANAVWEKHGLGDAAEVICLNPGAAFGAAKHWPTGHWVRLAQELVSRRARGVLVLCGPGERDLARRIATQAARPTVHSLADERLSLGLTKACVRRADLLITTDSGPRHFAAAFDRPVITLFGPTYIAWTETYHRRAIHLQKKVDCGPCQLRVCPLDHRCMTQLLPDEVLAAANDLLAGAVRKAT